MPNIASAKKRVRQTEKRTLRNRVRKERLKKALRSYQAALQSGDEAAIREELKRAMKAVDRAGDKGILHKNAVNRKKALIARQANRVAAGQ